MSKIICTECTKRQLAGEGGQVLLWVGSAYTVTHYTIFNEGPRPEAPDDFDKVASWLNIGYKIVGISASAKTGTDMILLQK